MRETGSERDRVTRPGLHHRPGGLEAGPVLSPSTAALPSPQLSPLPLPLHTWAVGRPQVSWNCLGLFLLPTLGPGTRAAPPSSSSGRNGEVPGRHCRETQGWDASHGAQLNFQTHTSAPATHALVRHCRQSGKPGTRVLTLRSVPQLPTMGWRPCTLSP